MTRDHTCGASRLPTDATSSRCDCRSPWISRCSCSTFIYIHIFIFSHIHRTLDSLHSYTYSCTTGWRRSIGRLISIDHFPPKSPIISGSFAKIDMQLKTSYGSLPPCTTAPGSLAAVAPALCVLIFAYIHISRAPPSQN